MRFFRASICYFTCFCLLVTQTACLTQGDMQRGLNNPIGFLGDKLAAGLGGQTDGDARFASGDFTLTSDEQENSNRAAEVFNASNTITSPQMYDPSRPKEARQLKAKLQGLIDSYQHRDSLTEQESMVFVNALLPFVNYLDAVQKSRQGSGIVIPPGERRSITLQSYCMDKRFGMPKPKEKFRLVPASTLLPEEMMPIYQGMMQHAQYRAQDDHQTDIQGALWALRETANGNNANMRPFNLSRSVSRGNVSLSSLQSLNFQTELPVSQEQQQILRAAHPQSIEIMQSHNMQKQLVNEGVDFAMDRLSPELKEIMGGRNSQVSQGLRQLRSITNTNARTSVRSIWTDMNAAPVNGQSATNGEYTLLADNVAARTTSPNGGREQVLLEAVNHSDAPYTLDPTLYAAQAQRGVQRLALQPVSAGEGIDDSEYESINGWLIGAGVVAVIALLFPPVRALLMGFLNARALPILAAAWAGARMLGRGAGKGLSGVLGKGKPASTTTKTPPKPSPNFIKPTNPPQMPPKNLPDGHSVRIMPPTAQYPKGYWVQTNRAGQPVNPATGKPPSNVSRPESRSQTHVPLP